MYLIFYVIEECHLAIFLYFLNINGQLLANVAEINCSEISGKYLVNIWGGVRINRQIDFSKF